MKRVKNAVAWTLTGVAFGALFLSSCASSDKYERYENGDKYTAGNASFPSAQIRKVEIDWLGGTVEVEQASSQEVKITEGESVSDDERMYYYLKKDGVLKIKYCKAGQRVRDKQKSLSVALPVGVSLDVDSTQAAISVGNIEVADFSVECDAGSVTTERVVCNEADVETVRGTVTLGELVAKEARFQTQSGSVSVARLTADFLEAESMSGDLSFGLQKAVQTKENGVETTSGRVTFTLLGGIGAELCFRTTSGKLETGKAYTREGARAYLFPAAEGAGRCVLCVETTSGALAVD